MLCLAVLSFGGCWLASGEFGTILDIAQGGNVSLLKPKWVVSLRLRKVFGTGLLCHLVFEGSVLKGFFVAASLYGASGLAVAKPLAKSRDKQSSGVFDLERLPVGKNVTFPRPATTLVPPLARVQLTGTDMPQSLSFKAVTVPGASLGPGGIRVAIHDPNADRVIYTEIQKDTVYLYHLKDLKPVLVMTEGGDHRLKLQVESNKPLDIGR